MGNLTSAGVALEEEQNELELEAMEDDSMDCEDMDVSLISLQNQSINRSGLSRNSMPTENTATQTEHYFVSYEPPRNNERVCSDKCKATCATLSSVVGISVEKARKALQIVCNQYFEDEVYLTKKEAEEAAKACSGDERHSKKVKRDKLKRVIASAKTINNYKHMQASQVERDAGLALLNQPDE